MTTVDVVETVRWMLAGGGVMLALEHARHVRDEFSGRRHLTVVVLSASTAVLLVATNLGGQATAAAVPGAAEARLLGLAGIWLGGFRASQDMTGVAVPRWTWVALLATLTVSTAPNDS